MTGYGGHEMLFAAALNIKEPLYIKEVNFNEKTGEPELHIYIDFKKGAKFACKECSKTGLSVHDTVDKEWRHLNFFQYKCFIHFRTPRIDCPDHGVLLAEPPWAGVGGFTLLMDAIIMQLAKYMAVKQIADLLDEYDTKIWRIIHQYVQDAYDKEDFSAVEHVGIDETSSKRRHNYVTLFVDMNEKRVLYATPGKSAETIKLFKEELPCHNGDPKKIKQICSDLSPAFISGIKTNFPKVDITFDKFHVVKLMNEAVDKTRRLEQKENFILNKSKYLWLSNPKNLKEKQQEQLIALNAMNLKTGRAYRIKLSLQEIYETATDRVDATIRMGKWYRWATRSRIEPVKEFAKTVKENWNGILNYFDSKLTNGILEGINSQVQNARNRARGYRNVNNFIDIIYVLAGKLSFKFIPKMEA